MQPEVFVVKHTADVRIIEYTLLGSLNRIAFFLNLKSATIIQYTIKGRFMSR